MKRVKRHKIKKEKPECSSYQAREQEEHDLAYYIHDRVELMHQVFSMLKYKELKAMAPECVRNLAIGDLQELCTEELLGISSKRLLAILDGAEPPSDTESSSPSPPPDLETISLDSISSDEELLASSSSKKKKHKHRHHSKSKKKEKSKEPEPQNEENAELSRASRAGLTVLELLELQARARAIRAQLQQEQANKRPSDTTAAESNHHSSDNDEVEIKEEPPDVVEISSEDEKPDVNQLNKSIAEKMASPEGPETETIKNRENYQNSQTVTKRINDLIITVPQAKPTRKIKLNRNKVTVSVPNDSDSAPTEMRSVTVVANTMAEQKNVDKFNSPLEKSSENKAKKKKKDKKKKSSEKDGSDHDEITLQLSDSEKMDLFEDLDESRKNYDRVSSSSEDTESSSSDSEIENTSKCTSAEPPLLVPEETSSTKNIEENIDAGKNCSQIVKENNPIESKEETTVEVNKNADDSNQLCHIDKLNNENVKHDHPVQNGSEKPTVTEDQINVTTIVNEITESTTVQNETANEDLLITVSTNKTLTDTVIIQSVDKEINILNNADASSLPSDEDKVLEITSIEDIPVLNDDTLRNVKEASQRNSDKNDKHKSSEKDEKLTKDSKDDKELSKETEKDLSDGELSDRHSSEVEAIDVQPVVVCISDEESTTKNQIDKKKKKKEKKTKKEKKSKKPKSDFCESADQNFYKDTNEGNSTILPSIEISTNNEEHIIHLGCDEYDDVYEIMELSDDSSCYEVEGTVLSKEPTAQEIEALSAKIDEIEREEVVTDEQIREHEQVMAEKGTGEQSDENVDNISWKDRYLGSNKVKKVLTTANILNALRKKNKELKKKIEDSKNKVDKEISNEGHVPKEINIQLEEGSIEQYNALQGSTKYVDPFVGPLDESTETDKKEDCDKIVTKEMKKDAKQLLKMYRRLLKHNNMNKKRDPNKKKKKKQKKRDKHD